MLGGTKKKLIIVVDDKSNVYGELLSALVTMKDDGADSVIGVKDGSVETVIWNEKIYADNQAQLGSNNKIVFLGRSDISKSVGANINCQNNFSAYGICYGCVSNKAVVYVDNALLSANKELYDEFYEKYCAFMKSIGTEFAIAQIKDKVEIKTENVHESEKERGAFAKKAFGVFHKIDQMAAKGISVLVNTKEIADQQNRCAIFAFYANMLATFMGE